MPLGIDFTQIFLHMFNVVILFGGLYILLYAPVKKFMEEREAGVQAREDSAAEMEEQARENRKLYEEKLSAVEEEIADMRRQQEKKMAEDMKEITDSAREEAKQILEDARNKARKERSRIVEGAKDDIARIIEDATKKVMEGGDPYEDFLTDAERSKANDGE